MIVTKTTSTSCNKILTEDPELKLQVTGQCSVICDILLEYGDGCYLGLLVGNTTTHMKFVNQNHAQISVFIPDGLQTDVVVVYSIGKASNPIILSGSTIGVQT